MPKPILDGINVLLVEDNEFNQQIVSKMLRKDGANVAVAGDGIQAIEFIKNKTFDCVLMDIQMPVLDGLEATRRIREELGLKQLPIFAMISEMEGDREKILRAGMDDVVSKNPVQLAKIIAHKLNLKMGDGTNEISHQGRDEDKTLSIDFSVLAEMIGSDIEIMKKFLKKFMESTWKGMSEIDAALADKDLNKLKLLGHRLKSSAKTVGAFAFSDVCVRLEKNDATDKLEQAGMLVAEMHKLLFFVEKDINDFLNA